jgi:hypothetical protein
MAKTLMLSKAPSKPINSKPIILMDLHGAFPNIVGNIQSIPWH